MKGNFEILFSPYAVKSLALKNRLVLPPMGTSYGTVFGAVTPRFIHYHRERAAGGVGINIVEFTAVEPRGRLNPRMLGIYEDAQMPGWKSLVDAVHEAGGKRGRHSFHRESGGGQEDRGRRRRPGGPGIRQGCRRAWPPGHPV